MSSNEVKVGALTLGGIGLLAGIITFLGAFSFSGSGYKLQISYPQVGGLMPGHVVRYAGVQVGTVKEVNVNGDSVDVVADINKDTVEFFLVGFQLVEAVITFSLPLVKGFSNGRNFAK